ncbi:patatin-like phospholipase family protein [Archangium violaceum]|uniref:patatin-like phospholipase family protein n=1 Tax=Archangium violaceum TaxID=83451 RepID=UPI001950F5A9|nr:patatin-like phospholipase family protein [Archangium violaceum]QRN94624.1 patatin-like phospholipase family protein [Archangium violaceum]
MEQFDKVDAVFEGGGVKGIGLVGAVEHLEELGVKFQNVVGTSAGAIVAALLASGYSAAELGAIMEDLDFRRFQDTSTMDRVPLVGPALSVLREKGLYEGQYFENWLRKLLADSPRKVKTFRDLHMEGVEPGSKYFYKLQVIAADVTRRKKLVLPRDILDYGIDPEDLDVARAVRMSMSIPFFFEPVRLKYGQDVTCYIVDGGVLSNFPVDILDDGTAHPQWPTFGFKLVDRVQEDGRATEEPSRIRGPLSLFRALFSTMMEAHDARYILQKNFDRTIAIPTLGVKTTQFGISRELSQSLRMAGRESARRFLETWNFEAWIQKHRIPELLAVRAAETTARSIGGSEPVPAVM